jgi:hypothetical protein
MGFLMTRNMATSWDFLFLSTRLDEIIATVKGRGFQLSQLEPDEPAPPRGTLPCRRQAMAHITCHVLAVNQK